MAINASVYNEDSLKFWLDSRHQTFLKPRVEIRGEVDGVDDPKVVPYELRVSTSGCHHSATGIDLSPGNGCADRDKREALSPCRHRQG